MFVICLFTVFERTGLLTPDATDSTAGDIKTMHTATHRLMINLLCMAKSSINSSYLHHMSPVPVGSFLLNLFTTRHA